MWSGQPTRLRYACYGFWYPGKENGDGAGNAFVPRAFGGNWFGKQQPRRTCRLNCARLGTSFGAMWSRFATR
jgi:hypothetical protein